MDISVGKAIRKIKKDMPKTRENRKFYEKMPRKFPYGVLPYAQYNYWTIGYCENDASS